MTHPLSQPILLALSGRFVTEYEDNSASKCFLSNDHGRLLELSFENVATKPAQGQMIRIKGQFSINERNVPTLICQSWK